jgi:hypothetical protein
LESHRRDKRGDEDDKMSRHPFFFAKILLSFTGCLLYSVSRLRSDIIFKGQWPKENTSQEIIPPPGMELFL